jgi:hypothetical protein
MKHGGHGRRVRALVEDLVVTLGEFNVPNPEQQEHSALGPMRNEIVRSVGTDGDRASERTRQRGSG